MGTARCIRITTSIAAVFLAVALGPMDERDGQTFDRVNRGVTEEAVSVDTKANLVSELGEDFVPEEPKMEGPGTRNLGNGLFEMTFSDGSQGLTHGLDPKSDYGEDWWLTGDVARPPVCSTTFRIHVLYGYPVGAPNRGDQVASTIRSSILKTNWFLNEESLASGERTADYKVLCDGGGDIKIDTFSSPGVDPRVIFNSAKEAGFKSTAEKYLIFFDDYSVTACGAGTLQEDERLSVDNLNNTGPSYAVAYNGCWTNRTPMHELGHVMGAVQRNAPNSTGSGFHCNEDVDVMCYIDGGNKNQKAVTSCPDRIYFDCGYHKYFDSETEAGEYLSNHWNIGWYYNRFISFSGSPPPPPPNPPPTANFTWSCRAAECRFVDSSADNKSVVMRQWSFGDGASSVAKDVTHTYTSSGTYNVDLTVFDEQGATGVIAKQIYVDVDDPDPDALTLTNGRWHWAPRSKPAGEMDHYKVLVPDNTDRLTLQLEGPRCRQPTFHLGLACDRDFSDFIPLDLYVRYGSRPTDGEWDCRPFEHDSQETCVISRPTAGYWFIGVRSWDQQVWPWQGRPGEYLLLAQYP